MTVKKSKQKHDKINLKKYTAMAILTAVSLILFTVEAALPPIPIQGVKLGFSNVVTLVAMVLLGKREAFVILAMRIILASVFTIMALTIDVFGEKKIWITSVLGAIFHNAGQLLVAIFAMGTPRIAIYAPVLLLAAIVTGSIIGVVTTGILKVIKSTIDN